MAEIGRLRIDTFAGSQRATEAGVSSRLLPCFVAREMPRWRALTPSTA